MSNVYYSCFKREENGKYASRMIEYKSTHDYPILEGNRAKNTLKDRQVGGLYIRFCNVPANYGRSYGDAMFSISVGNGNLSKVYPIGEGYAVAFGDVYGTRDAIVFLMKNVDRTNGRLNDDAEIEMYIFAGMKNLSRSLAERYVIGDEVVRAQMKLARERATETTFAQDKDKCSNLS